MASRSCVELANISCVFVLALGRTGSTHLLRLLNEIPGYRLTGETDNAWIYLGWWHDKLGSQHREVPQVAAGTASPITPNSQRSRRLLEFLSRPGKQLRGTPITSAPDTSTLRKHSKHKRGAARAQQRNTPNSIIAAGAQADAAATALPARSPSKVSLSAASSSICAMRELALLLHNPPPRARTFGFKEIYSPFVRRPSVFGDVFTFGVERMRMLFPHAKFVFHTRRNLSRTAESDFWHRERKVTNRADRLALFTKIRQQYWDYAAQHPDYAFATTLEGLTDRHNTTEVESLFRFLREPLTSRLRRVARSHMVLHDWVEDRHTRRIIERIKAANGTTI